MRDIPIFQMLLVKNNRNRAALIFSSELKHDISQDIIFCLPIYYKLTQTELLVNLLQNRRIIMPFANKDEILYLTGKINFPFINFNLNEININETIQFKINFYDKSGSSFFDELKRFIDSPFLKMLQRIEPISKKYTNTDFVTLNYIGNWYKILKNNSKFLILTPTNITLLDKLYKELKVVPVGYSPNFGDYYFEPDEYSTQQ